MGGQSSKTANLAKVAKSVAKKPNGNRPKSSPEAAAIKLEEMDPNLLAKMEKFDRIVPVEFDQKEEEEEYYRGYNETAMSYRESFQESKRNLERTLPQDRLARGDSSHVLTDIPGRLTTSQIRELLKLHTMDKEKWNSNRLAEDFGLKVETVEQITANVSPAKVLECKPNAEYPLGVWW